MRAWHTGSAPGIDRLTLADHPEPSPGASEIIVRTYAVALNYRDLLIVDGRYHRRSVAGLIPCSDAAGVVTAIGTDVSTVRIGDPVVTCFVPQWQKGALSRAAMDSTRGGGTNPGVLAEQIACREDAVVPVPDGLSFEEASTLPCAALTAWHALFEPGTPEAAGSVLTLGTGGVSTFAAQFALGAGAVVLSTSKSNEKLARLAALGVTHTINYRDVPLWGDRVRSLCGGEGVDHVIEVGGQGTLEQSLRAVRPAGTVSLIGTLAAPVPVSLLPVLLRNIRLQGVMAGSREMFLRMNAAIARWRIAPIVDRVFDFADVRLAYGCFAAGTHVGKIVIRTGPVR